MPLAAKSRDRTIEAMRSLLDPEPAASCTPCGAIEAGDEAPDFAFFSATGRSKLSDFRGSPVVLAFHGAHWDPARAEHIETYNRLIASLGGVAGAKLLEIGGGGGPWRDLTFADDSLALPVLSSSDGEVAALYGVGSDPAVFVIDAQGIVRWSQVGSLLLTNPVDVARAISVVAEPFVGAPNDNNDRGVAGWTRRDFVATTLASIGIDPTERSDLTDLANIVQALTFGLHLMGRLDPAVDAESLVATGSKLLFAGMEPERPPRKRR